MEILENSRIDTIVKENVPAKKCGICGDPHFYRDCKYVIISSKMSDKEVPTRARLSLPDILEIKKLADETESVFARTLVAVGTEFGPFIAKRNLTLHPSIAFPIKVFVYKEFDLEYYLDTTDENECCWMMFVKPANDVEEQNLICYQEEGDIFFGAIKDIQPGEELKVWYSPYCAFKMQKNTLTFKDSSKLELDVNKNSSEDLNALIKEQQKIIPRVVWNCKFCYKLEKNVTDFAKHLLTHYISHKKRVCQFCQKRFHYITDYKKHLKLFHGDSANKTNNKVVHTPQAPVKVVEHCSPTELKKNNVGGPLLLQCLTDSLDNSNSLLQRPEIDLLDMDNYDNHNLLFDNDNLRLNVDVIGSATMRDLDDFNPDAKLKESEKKEFLCDICLRKFATLKSISVHLRLHMGRYFCSLCKKVFGRPESYKHHKCNQVYSFKCPKCESVFYQKKYLVRHIALYHDKKLACLLCSKNFYSSIELKNHYCKEAPKEKLCKLKCSTCSKQFTSDRGLKNHMKNHSRATNYSIKYVCSECSATFSSKDIYQRHVMSIHKSRKYDCLICYKAFHRRDTLRTHMLNVHMLEQSEHFKCLTCKKEFKSKKYLDEHVRLSHSETKHFCKQCNASFKYSRNLSKHIKLVHKEPRSTEDMHECPVCHSKIKLKNSLQRHIRRKHPERYKSLCIELNARKDEIKHLKYKCPICKHEVKLKSSLQRHISKKHPEDYKNLCASLNDSAYLVDKEKKQESKLFDDEFDNYMDLQKTIENMDFNIDTCNDNLLSGSETIDKFLKESSDQISILFADSPKAPHVNDAGTSLLTDRVSHREVGLSMPDLSEIDHEVKQVKTTNSALTTNLFEPQMNISSDVVLYVLNEKTD